MFIRTILVVIFVFLLFSEQVYAKEPKKVFQNANLLISFSTWFSIGRVDWNHDASILPTGTEGIKYGNPTSELIYDDQESIIMDFKGDWRLPRRYFIRANGGFGGINDGQLFDDDNLVIFGSSDFPTSRTVSDVDEGNLWYLNVEFGRKLFKTRDGHGGFSPFIGYQHWQETTVARGVEQLICTNPRSLCNPAGTFSNLGVKAATNTAYWDSLRLGIDGEYHLTNRLGMNGYLAFIPFSNMRNKDIHHLRKDLQKNPSFRMDGTGIGFNLELNTSYRITENLWFNAGYRFWRLQVDDGTFMSFPISGDSKSVNLNDLDSQRYGATVGLAYQF